jgi:hypothetical protein
VPSCTLRVPRIELDELWAVVGEKQRNVRREDGFDVGDQWTFIGTAASAKAIISYYTGKRDGIGTNEFIRDLSERVLGRPEISFRWLPALPHASGSRG